MKIFCKEYEVMDFLSSQSELKLNHLVSYLIETSSYQSIDLGLDLSLIHISEPTRQCCTSRMPSSA